MANVYKTTETPYHARITNVDYVLKIWAPNWMLLEIGGEKACRVSSLDPASISEVVPTEQSSKFKAMKETLKQSAGT